MSAAPSAEVGARPTRRHSSEFCRTPSAQLPRALRSTGACFRDGVPAASGDSGTTSLSCESGTRLSGENGPTPGTEGRPSLDGVGSSDRSVDFDFAAAASASFCIATLRSKTAILAAASAASTSTECWKSKQAPSLGGRYPGYGPASAPSDAADLPPFLPFPLRRASASPLSSSSSSSRSSRSSPAVSPFLRDDRRVDFSLAPRHRSSSIAGSPPTHLTSARNLRQSAPPPLAVTSFPIPMSCDVCASS
mmetsp:Transcript_11826/g.49680  ORF Transcript_11826/g.49680 Transcript_11826/m.49680 type:complete len:249 (-) Transcript_11826:675-1421(-)